MPRYTVQAGADQQRKGQIRAAQRIGRAQLRAAVLALRGRDAYQLTAVFAGPGDISRCFAAAKAVIRLLPRVQKHRHLGNMGQNTGDDLRHYLCAVAALGGDVDVHPVARLSHQRLGREVGCQAVSHRHGIDDSLKGHGVIRRRQGIGIAKVDLVLPGALLMVRALRPYPHLLQRQADLPPHIFALVLRRDVHVPCVVVGDVGRFTVFAYAVMGIPSGILLQRVGYKKTALIAVAIGFIGVGIQFLSGHSSPEMAFAVYLIGAFVAGFSMCLLNTVVNPMLNKLGGEGNKGNQLIQVGGSFNSVMATITPMFVGILIAGSIEKATISQIFPVMYTAMAVFAFAFFVLLFVRIPEPNAAATTEPISTLMKGALKFRHFVLGAIAIFVYVGIEVGVPGTLNLFLTDPVEKGGAGIASTISGFVVGTYWFLMLIGRLAGASLGAKVSSKAMLTFTSALGLILVFLAIFSSTGTLVNLPVLQQSATGGLSFGFAEVPINAMYLVLVGLCTSIMWGGIFNLAVEGLGKYLAAASGLFMVLVCGGGILPVIQGWVADVAGFMASYWVIIAALAYLLYYGLVGCKNVNKDIPVE